MEGRLIARGLFSASQVFLFFALSFGQEEGFKLSDHPPDYIDVIYKGRIVARYMYAYDTSTPQRAHETYKPYLHVFDPKLGKPITKGPGGLYTHHRGIFIGWRKVQVEGKSYDLWSMSGGAQVHKRFLEKEATKDSATLVSVVLWIDRERKPLIREERKMTFRPLTDSGIVLIDLETKLEAARRDVYLGGDPEHAGCQYRPANEVVKSETTYVFPKEHADPRKDRDYPWVGETYTLWGKRYSVVHFNHPSNPKGTVYSAYRDYGRFGAFFTARLPLGTSLVLRYRFAVWEGEMPSAEKIQRLWDDFAARKKPSPVPKLTVKGGKSKR